MHPIERLRFVARSGGSYSARIVAAEAALGLAEVAGNDRPALVTAARRLLARRPALGPLWWVAACLVVSDDPWEAALLCVEELDADQTSRHLAALDDGAIVVEAVAAGPTSALVRSGRRGGVHRLVSGVGRLVLEAGVGVVVPGAAWNEIERLVRSAEDGTGKDRAFLPGVDERLDDLRGLDASAMGAVPPPLEVMALASLDTVVGPDGMVEPGSTQCRWELPPELTGIGFDRG